MIEMDSKNDIDKFDGPFEDLIDETMEFFGKSGDYMYNSQQQQQYDRANANANANDSTNSHHGFSPKDKMMNSSYNDEPEVISKSCTIDESTNIPGTGNHDPIHPLKSTYATMQNYYINSNNSMSQTQQQTPPLKLLDSWPNYVERLQIPGNIAGAPSGSGSGSGSGTPSRSFMFENQTGSNIPSRMHLVYECQSAAGRDVPSRVATPVPYEVPANGLGAPFEHSLTFDSEFESGNLLRAVQRGESTYDLFLRADMHTNGHTQWFYFAVSNTHSPAVMNNMSKQQQQGMEPPRTPPTVRIRFNIVNLTKPDSLFNLGMRPVVYSSCNAALKGIGWTRAGSDICYYVNNFDRTNNAGEGISSYFTLSFTLDFQTPADTVLIAYSYPFTMTDYRQHINHLLSKPKISSILRQFKLCTTLGGEDCDLLVITNYADRDKLGPILFADDQQQQRKSNGRPEKTSSSSSTSKYLKPAIFLSGRVHPGEPPASWMMKGILDFLTSEAPSAQALRQVFIIFIVPVLNPDGVIFGNNRCSLAGVDLNRQWKIPMKALHPTVFHLKNLMAYQKKIRDVYMYVDLHGHSRKYNVFMYGCDDKKRPKPQVRAFPRAFSMHSIGRKYVSFSDCSFHVKKGRESTARVVVASELNIPCSFTLEATFCGANYGPLKHCHMNIGHLMEVGAALCDAILNFYISDGQTKEIVGILLTPLGFGLGLGIGGGMKALMTDNTNTNSQQDDAEYINSNNNNNSNNNSKKYTRQQQGERRGGSACAGELADAVGALDHHPQQHRVEEDCDLNMNLNLGVLAKAESGSRLSDSENMQQGDSEVESDSDESVGIDSQALPIFTDNINISSTSFPDFNSSSQSHTPQEGGGGGGYRQSLIAPLLSKGSAGIAFTGNGGGGVGGGHSSSFGSTSGGNNSYSIAAAAAVAAVGMTAVHRPLALALSPSPPTSSTSHSHANGNANGNSMGNGVRSLFSSSISISAVSDSEDKLLSSLREREGDSCSGSGRHSAPPPDPVVASISASASSSSKKKKGKASAASRRKEEISKAAAAAASAGAGVDAQLIGIGHSLLDESSSFFSKSLKVGVQFSANAINSFYSTSSSNINGNANTSSSSATSATKKHSKAATGFTKDKEPINEFTSSNSNNSNINANVNEYSNTEAAVGSGSTGASSPLVLAKVKRYGGDGNSGSLSNMNTESGGTNSSAYNRDKDRGRERDGNSNSSFMSVKQLPNEANVSIFPKVSKTYKNS